MGRRVCFLFTVGHLFSPKPSDAYLFRKRKSAMMVEQDALSTRSLLALEFFDSGP